MKLLAAGGGTAGHLFPALSVIEEFQKYHDIEVAYVAVKGKIDEKVIGREHPSFKILKIRTRGLRRPLYHPVNLVRAFQYTKEILRVKKFARSFKPDFVFLTGGYAAGIVAMALKNSFPMFIHEQNAVPGLANLYAARYARKVFLSFESAKIHFPEDLRVKIEVVGNPVREVFFTKQICDVPDGIVLVMGGSLGSGEINELMERVYEVDRENVYYHSTGSNEWTKRLSRFPNVVAKDFFDCTPLLWRKAKFVVARAGATTTYEMIRYGVGGILIPWKGSVESHQIENAREAERIGLAKVLVKPDAEIVVEMVRKAVYNPRPGGMSPAKLVYEKIMEAIR